MTDEAHKPPEPMPWDRFGMFLDDMATVGKNMADRNVKLWSTISQHLRERPYTTDTWSDDAATSLEAAMANVQDAWEFWMRAPERERVAGTVPTAFLVFTQRVEDDGRILWDSTDPVWMRVPGADTQRLPPSAHIELSGSDPEGAARLKKSLSTTLGTSRQAYLLQVHNVSDLRPGVYSGSVYIDKPIVRPVANIRIIVEGAAEPEAPLVPTILLRFGLPAAAATKTPEATVEAPKEPTEAPAETLKASWEPAVPVYIRAPNGGVGLPKQANVKLTGAQQAAADELAVAVTADLKLARRAYELRVSAANAVPGVYSGLVYVTEPELRPLANLRIVVDDIGQS